MSNLIPITFELKFSYKVNDQFTTMSYRPSDPYYITINSINDINLILTPLTTDNIKWTDIMSYNLEIKNSSSSAIDNFAIKLDAPANLSYISETLVNAETGQFYPLIDWENEYGIIDTIPANSSLNFKYSMQINPNSGTSVISPVGFKNSGKLKGTTASNNSLINISEPRIIYDNANYTLQNTGTIPYSFTYKFTIPPGQSYKYAMLDSTVFTNIIYRQLASYAILTVNSLPPQTSTTPNLLSITFG